MRQPRIMATGVALSLLATLVGGSAEPAVFWTSTPVVPGDTVLVIGDDFGETPTVEGLRLPDAAAGRPAAEIDYAWPGPGRALELLQASPQCVKFAIPRDLEPGAFAYRIATGTGVTGGVLNRPQVWWCQQYLRRDPTGERRELRVFGRNLVPDQARSGGAWFGRRGPNAVLVGPVTLTLPVNGNQWSATGVLPVSAAELPPGDYAVYVHNGWGGRYGWTLAPTCLSVPAPSWTETARLPVLDVRDFGADSRGVRDATHAVQTALAKAAAAGGAVVYFPRGRYQVNDALLIPRFTVLRGEATTMSCLFWPDLPAPPEALLRGSNSFGVEDLTLYASRHRHVIAGDLGDKPEAGDVFLRRLRVRADTYRGHLKPEDVDSRFRDDLRSSTGGADTVRLGGRNIEITDCDLYGSGRVLFLSRVRNGRVAGNSLYNGRWGWYCISGSDGLIFEGNRVTGADLMSTGGGLNCLDGSTYSQNVYFANNDLSLCHGWDREAMTSDAGGDAYLGGVAKAESTALTLADPPKWGNRSWVGAGVFVLDGRGAGQYRRVVRHEGQTVELDAPWVLPPGPGSRLGITMFQGRYILDGNRFTDTGAMQFYGTSVECVVSGNQGTRMQGFRALGLWYHGYQPSWYCQFLGNRIREGNYYHWSGAADSLLDLQGARHGPYDGPLLLGAVLRQNQLDSQSHLQVTGFCRDILVERNRVTKADTGVFVSRQCRGVLLRENAFEDVAREVVDEEAGRRDAEARMRKFLDHPQPVAAWGFDRQVGTRFDDSSGNGFPATPNGGVTLIAEGIRGQAVSLDGTGYLRVDEPAVFNAPDITISLWVKPATVAGRRGFLSKRFAGIAGPFVFSQLGAALTFEAADAEGAWPFNFVSPAVLKLGEWIHVAAVIRAGDGVTLFANGQAVAEKKIPAPRCPNGEPLILGREAWGGDPPKGNTPGHFIGLMDEVRIWTRALTADEIRAESARPAAN